jgi:transposase-like protein
MASERKSSRRLGKEFKLRVLREAQESGATVKHGV